MSGWAAIRDALLLLAVTPLAYYVLAIIAARRFFAASDRANRPNVAFTPPVSILKPVRGLDREAYENFASFCRQDYPEFEILFCVSDGSEPAIPVIERLIRDFPDRPIRLLVGSKAIGVSDKMNKVCRMAAEARHEVVLVSDSDVRVDSGFLRAVVAPLQDAPNGGVSCLYRGLTDGSFASTLESLGNSTDFAPGVVSAWMLGDLDFMLGAVMVVTKRALADIGGFESLADYFCDDYELGNRLAKAGHRVELSRAPVSIVYPRETIGIAFRHQLRWNLSIRFSRPWGHFGLLFSQGLPWALLAFAIAPTAASGAAYLVNYAIFRSAMAIVVGYTGLQDRDVPRKLWLLPVRDAFAFCVWVASFFPQRIHWRDQEFYVRDKRLVPAPVRHS